MSIWHNGGRTGHERIDAEAERMFKNYMAAPPADLHCIPNGDAAMLHHHAHRTLGVRKSTHDCYPGARFQMGGRNFLVYDFQEAKSEPRRNSSQNHRT